MKNWTQLDTMELLGFGALVAGIWLRFGVGWGLFVFGLVLLGLALLSRLLGAKR